MNFVRSIKCVFCERAKLVIRKVKNEGDHFETVFLY